MTHTRTHKYTRTRTHIQSHIHSFTYNHIHIQSHIHTHTITHKHTRARAYTHTHASQTKTMLLNEEVRAKIQQAIGPREDLLTLVKRRKMKWYGHVSC